MAEQVFRYVSVLI